MVRLVSVLSMIEEYRSAGVERLQRNAKQLRRLRPGLVPLKVVHLKQLE